MKLLNLATLYARSHLISNKSRHLLLISLIIYVMVKKVNNTPTAKAKKPAAKSPAKNASPVAVVPRPVLTREEDLEPLLSNLQFRYPMRRYQEEILSVVDAKLKAGEREIHIVAPPGAGKTIIGLQLISTIRCPAIILCPNTTIQSQWGGKLDLFLPLVDDGTAVEDLLGTHDDKPLKPITVMTYQVLSTPGREQEYLEKLAHNAWVKELMGGRSIGMGDAELRVLEILQNNPKAHAKEISRHVSRLRKQLAEVMDLNQVLHPNAILLLQTLRRQKFKLVLFDECHHLTDYWAAIMMHLVKYLDDPLIIGLTGTPPEKKSLTQETRYLSLVGEIDYQVPTPALVREGGLAPFQDLAYFVEPTKKEFDFLSEQHEEFHKLIEELCLPAQQEAQTNPDAPLPPLTQFIAAKAMEIEAGKGFAFYMKEETDYTSALLRAMWKLRLPMPKTMELSGELTQSPLLEDWMVLIEDYATVKLKLSSKTKDHDLYERIRSACRKLGYSLTEQGLRRQASPVDRVLAFSEAKPKAVAEILAMEYRVLQERLRTVVVTDFEKTSATSVKTLEGILNEESGGAIAAMRILLASPVSEYINPTLVTGSLLLVDKRISEQFIEAANAYIKDEGFSFTLNVTDHNQSGYVELDAGSSAWESRLYVAMATAIFERGITKCLIGTRGLFGEGWDSQCLNTLIDLTTTTSPVSVKQLRGRSIRIQTNDALGARKVANNWDVVCIAPSLEKGLNDYHRFVRKHDGFFGICDDGQIECGVGHVHPAFSELTPAEVFASTAEFNREMMDRALVRDQIYDLWKVGQPYNNRLVECVEVARMRKMTLTPPNLRHNMPYSSHARELREQLNGVWFEYLGLSSIVSIIMFFFAASLGPLAITAAAPLALGGVLGRIKHRKLYEKLEADVITPGSQEQGLIDMATAVLVALQQIKLVPMHVTKNSVQATIRTDGSYRVFLDDVEAEVSKHFSKSLSELLAPVSNQPYLVSKYEFPLLDPLGAKIEVENSKERFFKKYLAGRAEPFVASYHGVPSLLARSERGREAFQEAWNKYVSPGSVIQTETKPELLNRYFGIGPSLAQRLLWE